MTFFPTNHYPGIYWPGSRQVEAALPVTAAPPFFDQLTADNIAASGIRETIVLRSEERRQLTFFGLDAPETVQWGQYFTERGGRGQQAELLVDRFTGKVFTFANTTADQNTDLGSFTTTVSYQMVNGKIGVVFPTSSGMWLTVNVGSVNTTVVASEGTVVVSWLSSFAGNDGVDRYIFQVADPTETRHIEALKQSDNTFRIRVRDDAGVFYTIISSVVNWPAGTIVSLIVRWTMGGSLSMALFVPNSAVLRSTASLSGATLTFSSNHRMLVGQDAEGLHHLAYGVLLHFATYKKAYDDVTLLTSHFPLGRNYYSRAEVVERTFNPSRIAPGVDAWQWTWTFRQGF